MLPTFVIGLREGLEAALIVGIIAAFLRQQGRKDLLRWVFAGVGIAVTICVAIGVVLNVVNQDLPQRQQEGMETVIGFVAVGMVTYMVVWMKRHSRDLKGQLEGMASEAIAGSSRSGRAMIVMAFLAVLREGIETVVFLLATLNEKHVGAAAPFGVVLGLALAVVLGYGIYRGGVRLNLSKFFRVTGLVLVLVAAGLVVNALHTAHEAGWLNSGQGSTIDLTWLVRPGSVQASLLTSMLGVQPHPVVIEAIGWLVYLIPVGLFVAWPPGRGLARRTASRVLLGGVASLAVVCAALLLLMPSRPSSPSAATAIGGVTVSTSQGSVSAAGAGRAITLDHTSDVVRDGVTLDVWAGHAAIDEPALHQLSYAEIASLNGGRLPIGARTTPSGVGSLRYTDISDYVITVDPATSRVVTISVARKTTATLVDDGRALPLANPVAETSATTPAATARAALHAAADARTAIDDRSVMGGFAWFSGVLAMLGLLAAGALRLGTNRGTREHVEASTPLGSLVRS